jgi:hypothetical protein
MPWCVGWEGERAGEGERGYVWYRKYFRNVKKVRNYDINF